MCLLLLQLSYHVAASATPCDGLCTHHALPNYSEQLPGPSETQNRVPSLTISIGGPPDSGRFSFAISRPPFHVALSSTCARVSCSFDRLSLALICSAIRSLVRGQRRAGSRDKEGVVGVGVCGEKGVFQRSVEDEGAASRGKGKHCFRNEAVTHSSITVMARHSTMAGCEGGSRGMSEDAEG